MVAALVCAVGGLVGASAASAADRVYWANDLGNKISFAALDGSGGGGDLSTTGATVNLPVGLALFGAEIYWANAGANQISFARLDGSGGGQLDTTGATVNNPQGVAVDPTDGTIYWANFGANKISFADTTAGGGHDLNTTGATVNEPEGVAVDPALGLIYWANAGANVISFARLNGTGGGNLDTTGATVNTPIGVAVDPVFGQIYWANFNGSKISFTDTTGGGGHDLTTTGATVNGPQGVAVDNVAGRVIWANAVGNKISFAKSDGSGGGGDLATTGASVNGPNSPLLLHAPTGAGVPVISGGATVGGKLVCPSGTWTADVVASFDYHAPQAFAYSWRENGATIAGATTSTLTTGSPGSYTCRVTASNQAGSAVQVSAAFTVSAAAAGGTGNGSTGATGSTGGTGGPSGGGVPAPVASRLSISPAVFAAAGSGPSATTTSSSRKKHHPVPGATVSYQLNIAATVRFTVQRRLPGRIKGTGTTGRCVARTKTSGKAHSCMRTVTLSGSFTQTGTPGTNGLRFTGRLNGHRLAPGAYTLAATPTAGGDTGRAVTVAFRISLPRAASPKRATLRSPVVTSPLSWDATATTMLSFAGD